MSTTKTLDEQLNNKADREFDLLLNEATKHIFYPKDLFKSYDAKDYYDSRGERQSFYNLGCSVRKALEVYREEFRERFKAEFIGKVAAMQAQMEQYIGELEIEREQHE